MGIFIMKIRRSWDRLIFIIGSFIDTDNTVSLYWEAPPDHIAYEHGPQNMLCELVALYFNQ